MKIIIADIKYPGIKQLLGYCDYERKEININKRLKLRKKIKVLIHELIHYFIHKYKLEDNYNFLLDIITTLIVIKSKRQRKKIIKFYFNYYYN